ncbi:hypothetical protein BAU01nite_20260 [Brevibacterium aurantiacum]|uniref:Uncharacterized protein n=2 Tax=Brevibacterium aurantiacum TaxID=273384 RepID=A0A2H1K389_BREAU|nr:hypothetical protein BAU01nite_20260 [Brevibacterium aurantiacum]SMX94225.1 hypothetical protein BAUR9175_03083 [Brevibacterium aurantiacum]
MWIEWPPANGFDVFGSLFNTGGPAWILVGLGVLATVVLSAMIMTIVLVARDRGRAFQRQVDAEIERRERRRGEGSSVGRHCTLSTSSEWGSSTPTGWKVNTHDQ